MAIPPRTAGTEALMSRPDHGSQAVRSLHTAGIREVAAAANVSTATVSRALRGLPRVSAATRQKVLAAANNLGYVASAAASELARGRGSQDNSFPRGTILVVLGPERAASPSKQALQRPISNNSSRLLRRYMGSACPSKPATTPTRLALSGRPRTRRPESSSPPAPSNTRRRQDSTVPWLPPWFRRSKSVLARAAAGILRPPARVVISGAGILGYKLAIEYLAHTSANPGEGEPAWSGSPAP